MNISEALTKLRNGDMTATMLIDSYLNKIETSNLNEYITITADSAREQAKALDTSGDYSKPLAGIPVAVKDIICTKGVKTTAASRIIENFVPPYSATVYEKLEQAGAIMVGKANCDEFAMGSSTENSAFGNTLNPHGENRVPGGSSGGSAAAVAGGSAMFAMGTDTGGSIRQPANFCGCTGLKVTYGRVSRYGVVSYASSFDTIGPITKTVEDAARVLEVIAGKDEKDSTTPDMPVENYSKDLDADISGKKIGLPVQFFEAEGMDPQVKAAALEAAELLKSRGAIIENIDLPLTEYAIPTYYLLVKAEASTNLARYDGVRFGSAANNAADLTELYEKTRGQFFGPEAKRAIMMGTFTLSSGYVDAYYKKAAAVRAKFAQEYADAFTDVDAILAPVSPTTAFQIGEKAADPLQMYLADIFTISINLAGIPSLAVPTKKIDGLPTGVQIMGKQFDEKGILNIGWHLEQAAGFFEKRIAD
jgi:aspartyl-tRNA(Asn)/glutamyl-tRNA(Gln) amidotransferase subunit A